MKRALLFLCLLAGLARAQELHFAADRPFDLEHLRLTGRVDLKAKTFTATAAIRMRALRGSASIRLDAVGLEIHAVRVLRGSPPQPQAVEFTDTGEALEILLAQPARRDEAFRVEVDYTCRDPEYGLAFRGPTEAEPDTPYQVWSQGQTIGTRYWIPIFDQPNDRLTTELIVTVDGNLQVLSNGRKVSVERHGDHSATWHWQQARDHVPYLISMVVGTFGVVEDSWRGRPVEYWVPPGRVGDAQRSFGNTPRILDFFSEVTGFPYPWSKYAQVVVEQYSFGGMENTSATTLNERTLHDERAHLDFSSDGLVSHELAHQWFGDLITCREWAHTWLNEGFATYFQALWTEHDRGSDEFLFDMLGKARSAIEGGKDLPIVHRAYKQPWDQFDARTYPKGAWVLHMIRRRLGDETWRRCVKSYVERHQHACVETVDWRRVLEDETGESFERFFHDWTDRPGHPVVELRHGWNAKNGLAEVRVVQKQKAAAFHFPLRIQYWIAGIVEPRTVTHPVATKDARFYLSLPSRPVRIAVDPDAAVLMELTEHKGRHLWLAQLRSDENLLARVRAAEHFGATRRDEDRKALAEALGNEAFWGVQVEIAKALGKSGGTVARDTLLKALSLEHPKARQAVVEALGKFRDDDTVRDALEAIVRHGDASYQVEAAAVTAWSGLRAKGALATLMSLLERDSHREVIREAALKGLGAQQDAAATGALIEWTRRGKPRGCRRTALEALGGLGRTAGWDDATTKRVVESMTLCLHRDDPRRIKTAAVQALRDLGEGATPALAALEALAEHDSSDGVREEAGKAVDRIREGAPARIELQRLREELRKMREADRKLEQRLERLENRQPVSVDGKGG